MFAAARDAAAEIARVSRSAAQVYEERADQFDLLHTEASQAVIRIHDDDDEA